MKLQVTQENLNKALGTVARVANTRNALPILANVLLKTTNNRLSVAATNLDIAITEYCGAKVSEEGSITVPARLMQDFISNLPHGVIELRLEENKLHISTDQYNSVINGVVADDFPVMPAITDGKTWQISGQQLKKGLQQVIFAASNDQTRPVLTGVLLHSVKGMIYLAATDSHRLAEKNLGASEDTYSLLIPATAMQDLLRIIGDLEGDVRITSDDQQVLFQAGDVELVARLIDANYPDYRRLIPESFQVVATVKRTDLVNVTKVSSLFARESAGSITMNIDEQAQTISVRSVASQLGENTSNATGKVTGSGSITLNSRYLLDALQVMNGDEVSFCFNGKLEAAVVRDPKADDYVHIIMPLKS
ncbi:MAG: dnaN [Candidatus Saccharibacteria bacterium]|nr:dnaN [Candidatus Saccharibacteria bacterium]